MLRSLLMLLFGEDAIAICLRLLVVLRSRSRRFTPHVADPFRFVLDRDKAVSNEIVGQAVSPVAHSTLDFA